MAIGPTLAASLWLAQVDLSLPPLVPGREHVLTESPARLRYLALWDVSLEIEVEAAPEATIRVEAGPPRVGAGARARSEAIGRAVLALELAGREPVEVRIEVDALAPGATALLRARETPGFGERSHAVEAARPPTAEQLEALRRHETLVPESIELGSRDREAALRLLRAASDDLDRVDPSREILGLSAIRSAIAKVSLAFGDPELALDLWAAVVACRERFESPAGHELQSDRVELGRLLLRCGACERAREELLHAVHLLERTRPADDLPLLLGRYEMARHASELGMEEGALETLRQVASALEGVAPSTPTGIGSGGPEGMRSALATVTRRTIATKLSDDGAFVEASLVLESLLHELRPRTAPDDWELITLIASAGGLRHSIGEVAGAREMYEEALDLAGSVVAEHHGFLKVFRSLLLRVLDPELDADLALDLAHRQVSAAEAAPEDRDRLLAAALEERADWLAGSGRVEEALLDLDRARDLRVACRDDPPESLVINRARRARIVALAGDPRAALDQLLALLPQIRVDPFPVSFEAEDRNRALEWAARMALAVGDPMRDELIDEILDLLERRNAGFPISTARAAAAFAAEDRSRIALLITAVLGDPPASSRRIRVFEQVETMAAIASWSWLRPAAARDDPLLAARTARARSASERVNDAITGAVFSRDPAASLAPGDLREIERARELAEHAVRERLAELGFDPPFVSLPRLGERLPTSAAVVAFRRFLAASSPDRDRDGDHLLAFVVLPGSHLETVDLGPVAPIAAAIDRWRDAIRRGGAGLRAPDVVLPADPPPRTAPEELDRELRERVLEPVLAATGDATSLFLRLDGPLHPVPWDAIRLAGGESLGDRCEVTLLPSLVVEAPALTEPSRSLLVVGDVDYGRAPATDAVTADVSRPGGLLAARSAWAATFEPLPKTREECERIASLFAESGGGPARSVVEDGVSKDRLRELASGSRFLHVATHGFFAGERVASVLDVRDEGGYARVRTGELVVGLAPMTLCGLALSGANGGMDELGRMPGVLTAEELCTFDLSGCELAVLSACSTSAGVARAGQGVASLQAALHAAGARHAVTSLWSVDDSATARWMAAFYRALWSEGLSVAQAVRRTKQELRDAGAPLADWAGWVHSTTLRAPAAAASSGESR